MPSIRLVIEYTGLDMWGVLQLPIDLFKLSVKNAYIEKLNQSKEGKEYLADCERYKQTDADIEHLSRRFNIIEE